MYLDGQGGKINKELGLKYLDLAAKAEGYDLVALAASKLLKEIYEFGYFDIKKNDSKLEFYQNIYNEQNLHFEN